MHMIRPLATLALSALACTVAWADDDIWTRATLLDVPDGPKQVLKAKGIDLAVDVTHFLQGLETGGSDYANGGKADLRIRLDGQKLGTWPGFFISSHIEYNYGNDVNQAAPGLNIIPINTALAYPSRKSSMFSLLFTQAFSATTTLTAGLFNMFDVAARRPLVGGGGIDTFWNLAVAAPLTNITPPYIYGVSLNTRNDLGSFGLFIYDPRDAQDRDIISDLCAGLVGGLGVVPGSNFGDEAAMFEAVHGSAPDIAGKNVANPLALIMSGVLMLRHIHEDAMAAKIETAYKQVLAEGKTLTPDLKGTASTTQFADAIIAKL